MHFPSHPAWFWIVLASPFLSWLILWIVAEFGEVSLKPLLPWVTAGVFIFAVANFVVQTFDTHKYLTMAVGSIFYSCLILSMWIRGRYRFDTLRPPGDRWGMPWKAASFSLPHNTRIVVRDMDAVSPWYVEKLGLRRLAKASVLEPERATYSFKADGNSIVLTTNSRFDSDKTPILFTKKLMKMQDVLAARGIPVGTVQRDRQGIRYFEIRDPEGDVIEVVEEQ